MKTEKGAGLPRAPFSFFFSVTKNAEKGSTNSEALRPAVDLPRSRRIGVKGRSVMRNSIVLAAAILAGGLFAFQALAQTGGPSTTTTTPEAIPPSMEAQTNTSANQVSIFGNYQDQADRLSKSDKAKGKTIADLMAQDRSDVTAILEPIHFYCKVTSAVLASAGPMKNEKGETVDTKTYEVACEGGLGYFIIAPQPGTPYGFTCFGASAAYAADTAAGRKPGPLCGLPANQDVKAMAQAVVTGTGKACKLRDMRWIGQSAKTNTDYTEAACADTGYVIASPLPGSSMKPVVVGCHDSYLQGIPCKLSDNGPQVVTMQSLLDVIAQHHVACRITGSRLVGKEAVKGRHIVELKCADRPEGVVAYVPAAGTPEPFETVDCRTAGKRGATCTLTKVN
ncbi:MAG: hypothetical protein KGJ78_06905 [Alphaproteobacteria bacterium]|nr:hypothetical protein [Alphaproteobacteria bacterium]